MSKLQSNNCRNLSADPLGTCRASHGIRRAHIGNF